MLDLDASINCVCICDDGGCCHETTHPSTALGLKGKNGSECPEDLTAESTEGETSSAKEARAREAARKKKMSSLCTPPPLLNSSQLGVTTSPLYSGSKFGGYQTSKGNSYQVEVVFQVRLYTIYLLITKSNTKISPLERGRSQLLPVRLPDDQGPNRRVPDDDDLLRGGDHLGKESLPHAQVGS